jgi:putative sterol carrier protein
MTIKFISEEWIKELSRQLNESKDYERAGKDWEGDFIFVIEPDESHPNHAYFFLGLLHGKSPDAALVASENERKAEFKIRARYSAWRKVIEGKLDPIQGMMTGKLKLEGDLLKVMRHPKAAKEMVACCSKVPTDFEDPPQK